MIKKCKFDWWLIFFTVITTANNNTLRFVRNECLVCFSNIIIYSFTCCHNYLYFTIFFKLHKYLRKTYRNYFCRWIMYAAWSSLVNDPIDMLIIHPDHITILYIYTCGIKFGQYKEETSNWTHFQTEINYSSHIGDKPSSVQESIWLLPSLYYCGGSIFVYFEIGIVR